MHFFKSEINLNPEQIASHRIIVTCRRYVGSDARWYAELDTGFDSRYPRNFDLLDSVQGDRAMIKKFIAKYREAYGEKNKWGFSKGETLSNLCKKHGLNKTKDGLFSGEKLVFRNPEGGALARINSTWLFFKDLECRV